MSWEKAWRAYRRWWLGLEVSPVKLTLFRVTFFALLGLNAWLEVAHAPRYGAGGFNVSHVTALGWLLPTPSRALMLCLFLAQGYLALRLVFGEVSRIGLGALAALFGAGYFISQVDSYQHHYLIFLLLICACFVPFGAGDEKRSAWAVRLILVQVSLLYFWAAISKLDPLWLDGHTLAVQIRVDWVRDLVEAVFGAPAGPGDFGGWSKVAKLVLMTELFLAVAIHVPLLRRVALVVGPLFHLSVELSGFKIGLFSYFMIALYILVVPDPWLERLASMARPALEGAAALFRRARGALAPAGPGLAAIAAGSLLLLALPWSGEAWWAAGLAFVFGAVELARRRPVALAHLLACAALVALAGLHSEPARDHYRYWGGSHRRLGEQEEATRIYQQVVDRWPDYAAGHTSLGNLYRRAGEDAKAIEQYRRAEDLSLFDDRPYLGEAMCQRRTGRTEEAIAAARSARWRAYLTGEHRRRRRADAILARLSGARSR